MRRGAKPAKAKVESKPPVARKSLKNESSRVGDLEKRLAEALEQQTATSEILQVISRSQTDVQPVFETILRNATRLCGPAYGLVFRVENGMIGLAAHDNLPAEGLADLNRRYPAPLSVSTGSAQAARERSIVQVADAQEDPKISEVRRRLARMIGYRGQLFVPIVCEDRVLGVIALYRPERGPFPPDQVMLLRTYADQARIAIENVRLFNETEEALEQQTATAEILRVISRATSDLTPVFQAVVDEAVRLCEADNASLLRRDGDLLRYVTHAGSFPERERFIAYWADFPLRPGRGTLTGRVLLDRRTVQIDDVDTDPEYDPDALHGKVPGSHTHLAVPLQKDGEVIGLIMARRFAVRPFTPRQIGLLETFANQAVIAIENVRLFKELETRNRALAEALEQQTATADILRVISASPTDLTPVLNTVVQSAARFCGSEDASLFQLDGDTLRQDANHGPVGDIAGFRVPVVRGTVGGRTVLERRAVHVADIQAEVEEFPEASRFARRVGHRTILSAPLLREGTPIGVLQLRRAEVNPFTDKQIALLQTFADQAVIAIENVRLFTELQDKNRALTQAHAQVTESLDQQTATSEILSVISRSQTDVQPVFDTIAQSAVRLCDAVQSLVARFDGELVHLMASFNLNPEGEEALRRSYPQPPSRELATGRAVLEGSVVHIPDVLQDPEFSRQIAQTLKVGAALGIPMLLDGRPIGAIGVARNKPRPFSDNQIALLKTFADQAVIAIENARLFTETKEALERQTATSEILRVISGSPTDVQPVFDTILDSATRLCAAENGILFQYDDGAFLTVACRGLSPEAETAFRAQPARPGPHSGLGRMLAEKRPVQVADVTDDIAYRQGDPLRARTVTMLGARTAMWLPLLKGDAVVGALAIYRRDVRPFTEQQIALVQTFADQAVIAIENARLFKELQARTAQLTRSVEQLTALGDVGRTLSSTLDLDAVLQTIVTRASQLAGTDACSVFEYDEATEAFYLRATHNLDEEVVALARRTPTRKGEGVQGRMAVTRQPVQIPDIAEEGVYRGPMRDILLRTGTRAVLAIPMLREDQLIGGLTVNRKTPGEFAPEVIELLRTFATQSALAIQNARLFREIADKSRQLEAASQHKSEFLANMSHELRTPLNAIIGFSEVLTERMFGELNEKQDEYLKDIYASGQHLLSLINDILDLSKIEAGRMELELTDFHLPEAISNALTLVRGRAGRRDIALHQAVDQGLGQIRGDERKIKQVLLNLLSNALKFTPEGGRVDVRASVVDSKAEISVTDTGVGIAPEDQEAVFEEFRQVGTADKKVEGTGLGLALSRKFIELHGGRIWVKSQVGMGSTFTFTLPLTIDQRHQTASPPGGSSR